ncbi:RNA-guided endonuclease InsQ/TnpB family protein [Limnoraphis robusta]|uniref:Transposase n=1 Tax=Limnoraphis robusta CCNP1315 TaxID=3110306 RepID=A0ABU5TW02_9CYAN|nr:transposase [Limnoraphis robusta]MEA5496959.1 transposase [Limnoraphis robusta BA-68 BA1]MEA5519083.1 transposase [Limnoraphis robusta CCNP1315]
MEQVLTIVCKIQPTPEQAKKLDSTLGAFADACNYINSTVNPKIKNKNRIQAEVYQTVRERFKLSANLAVRACARVASNRKTAAEKKKPVKGFKPTSADYDARIFSYREKDQTVSLSTVEGRERVQLILGNYQIGKLKGKTPTSATLSKHRDGQLYIHIQIKDTSPTPKNTDNIIGVDLGRSDIAVTSLGESWSGESITRVRDKFNRVRASVQKRGTKGAKRLLKRLSGREKRYQTWVNHNISKQIISCAIEQVANVAVEDLTGIRKRTNTQPRNKTERRRSNNWAFYQLRQFLHYKGVKVGVEVIAVSPRYTSQTCHKCLHIHPEQGKSYRNGKNFKCGHCGWKGDADLNGAKMISIVGQSVSLPVTRNPLSCSVLEAYIGLVRMPRDFSRG